MGASISIVGNIVVICGKPQPGLYSFCNIIISIRFAYVFINIECDIQIRLAASSVGYIDEKTDEKRITRE